MSCACALWLTGSSIHSKPKAAMRMFELVTDCLVCIGFFLFEVCFLFWFSGLCLFVPVHVLKRKGRPKPATTAQFFLIGSVRAVKNPSVVLECAASSSLYDDALFHATRGHPIARRLEWWR